MSDTRGRGDWVHETRFGTWFLSTDVWRDHVLTPALRGLVEQLGSNAPARRVLDVGCGEGQALPMLDAQFRPDTLIGIDVDPSGIARAAEVARELCCENASVRVAEASKLDWPDASFDLVFCHQTAHHLSQQTAALHELYRVLEPGGVLLFAESCRGFIESWLIRALFRHPMEVQKTSDEYLALLREVGFEFGPEQVSNPYPPWARPDLGLLELVGRRVPAEREKRLVQVVAVRPA